MPMLQGDAYAAYEVLFGSDTYNAQHENYDQHDTREPHLPPLYRPRHDIESLFWVIIDILLHAKPEQSDDRPSIPLTEFEHMHKGRRYGHGIEDFLFHRGLDWWRKALHPELRPVLAELLHQMSRHVGPEYEYLIQPPCPTHLHEMFCRLLLQAIVELNGQPPITLDSSRRIARDSNLGPLVSSSLAVSSSDG